MKPNHLWRKRKKTYQPFGQFGKKPKVIYEKVSKIRRIKVIPKNQVD